MTRNESLWITLPWIAGAMLLQAASSRATTYVMPTDDELLSRSDVVVLGQVFAADPSPATRSPATDYLVDVEEVVKGFVPASTLLVRVPGGGNAAGVATVVWGAPVFRPEERVLLFLKSDPSGSYRLIEQSLGAFRAVELGGRGYAVRNLGPAHEVELEGDSQRELRRKSHLPRDLSGFIEWLSRKSAGRFTAHDYFIPQGPVAQTVAKFQLITSGTQNPPSGCGPTGGNPARVREFESGATWDVVANSGGQTGIPGGGFASVEKAMAAWNDHAGSDIRLHYDGTTGNSHSSLTNDGANLILFEDPAGDINGTFTGSGGGTLAQTVSSFYCNLHNFQNGKAHAMVETDIVTQDGFHNYLNGRANPVKDFEEVMAHELGHTLGLAHSCTNSCSGTAGDALMTAFAHGDSRGARLGSDDKAAASYLYSNGSTGGNAPAAPKSLSAVVLSTSQIQLAWTDASSNEDAFDVDEKTATGSYQQIASLPAGSTSLVVTNIPSGTYRSYRVKARNAHGSSAYSNEATATTNVPVSPCSDDAVTLCLNGGRFRVRAKFQTQSTGDAQANEITSDTGFFTFFDPDNVELVIKVLNACSPYNKHWVFVAGLTNVQVVLTVGDTQTGKAKTYLNPQGQSFQPVQDTSAFACP